jgi:hypothetical protein
MVLVIFLLLSLLLFTARIPFIYHGHILAAADKRAAAGMRYDHFIAADIAFIFFAHLSHVVLLIYQEHSFVSSSTYAALL